MKHPCLSTCEGEEKEFFRASMPAAPAEPGWAAARSSRFQKGNDSLVFPLGKPFLIQSKLFFFFKAVGSQACQTQLSFLLQILLNTLFTILGFPCGSAGKESAFNVGDLGLIPGLGRSPGEEKGYTLQYSGLENSMDSIVHGVAKSQTRLSDFHLQSWSKFPRWYNPPTFIT